jgi:hypothetical protein
MDTRSEPEGMAKRLGPAQACNQCRKRKVRCSAETPSCRNCQIRGDSCEPAARPNSGPSTSRWAAADGMPSPGGKRKIPQTAPDRPQSRSPFAHQHGGVQSTVVSHSEPVRAVHGVENQAEAHSRAGDLSWVSRAYHESDGDAPDPGIAKAPSPDMVMNTDDDSSHRIKVCTLAPHNPRIE